MTTVSKLRILSNGKVQPAWHAFNTQISDHPGFVVIEVDGAGLDLLLAVKSEQPAAVILHGASEQSGITSHLLSEFPDLTVLKLYDTGEAFIAQRCLNERQIVPTDAVTLSETLRHAVEDPCLNGERRLEERCQLGSPSRSTSVFRHSWRGRCARAGPARPLRRRRRQRSGPLGGTRLKPERVAFVNCRRDPSMVTARRATTPRIMRPFTLLHPAGPGGPALNAGRYRGLKNSPLESAVSRI